MQVFAFMTCVHSEGCLITLWWERRAFKSDSSPNQCNFGDSISFQGGRRGEISFHLKQTRLANDKPHCGRTSDQLIICLFHVQNSTNLQVLPEKKRKRPSGYCFHPSYGHCQHCNASTDSKHCVLFTFGLYMIWRLYLCVSYADTTAPLPSSPCHFIIFYCYSKLNDQQQLKLMASADSR